MYIKNLELKNGLPKICIPLIAKNKEELKTEINTLKDIYYDLIEWRIDHYEKVEEESELLEALELIRQELPDCVLLVTFRTIYEGGNTITKRYADIYRGLIKTHQIDLIDVEFSRGDELFTEILKLSHHHHVGVIASYHDFSQTPSKKEMMACFEKMKTLQADIFKLAVMPKSIEDVLALLEVTYKANKLFTQPIITMSMSKLGFITRATGELFGSAVTFGSGKEASAPGQISAEQLRQLLLLMHEGL
ncbi:type I 3-dehydroquinate dehydratase [Beduini massiliensis]|uniref:type I 3-dehydroquinate dehydratase n=1 Tax=Beduini massiliensis TaxID=1585974 RepID=UPI00059A9728|nr:type I 3-dehydroquinate dehydratase [Beduini massiliensis]